MKSYKDATNCPNCGYQFTAASGITTDAAPKPGDLSLCLNCGTQLIFTNEIGGLRVPTMVELNLFKIEAADQYAELVTWQKKIIARGPFFYQTN
jgi:hypothetical protein